MDMNNKPEPARRRVLLGAVDATVAAACLPPREPRKARSSLAS
jgi:hypothetical protein